jgi:hypothetical protein
MGPYSLRSQTEKKNTDTSVKITGMDPYSAQPVQPMV